jgi:hypothetical protein
LPVTSIAPLHAFLPVGDGEAFWMGLRASGEHGRCEGLAVAAKLGRGIIDVISGGPWRAGECKIAHLRARPRIEGIQRADGRFDVLGRAPKPDNRSCSELRLQVAGDSCDPRQPPLTVEIVDYETFQRRTGIDPPSPLDTEAGYKSYRLP